MQYGGNPNIFGLDYSKYVIYLYIQLFLILLLISSILNEKKNCMMLLFSPAKIVDYLKQNKFST